MTRSSTETTVAIREEPPPPPPKRATRLSWEIMPLPEVYVGDKVTMKLCLRDYSYVDAPFPIPIGGKAVDLYRNGVKIKSGTTNGNGYVTFTDTLTAEGSFDYYAQFEEDAKYAGCSEEFVFW